MHLPESIFREIVNFTPLVAIDLVIEDGDGNILLGKRKNKPARGKWFVPGGRIKKGEILGEAFARISKSEIGIELVLDASLLIGVFEHHYEDSIFENVSTHYVVLAYRLLFNGILKCDNQHETFEWRNIHDRDDEIHTYTKAYMEILCQ